MHFLFGQRPRREPEGTKSCRIQGESVRPSVCPFLSPLEAPWRLALAIQRLAQDFQSPEPGFEGPRPAFERPGPASEKPGPASEKPRSQAQDSEKPEPTSEQPEPPSKGPPGEGDRWTDGCTDSPCILQDFVPSGSLRGRCPKRGISQEPFSRTYTQTRS